MTDHALPDDARGLRLARINSREELVLCECVMFKNGRAGVDVVLRRAGISGRVEIEGDIQDHFADVLNSDHNIIATVALDRKSYGALKNKWMKCKVDRFYDSV